MDLNQFKEEWSEIITFSNQQKLLFVKIGINFAVKEQYIEIIFDDGCESSFRNLNEKMKYFYLTDCQEHVNYYENHDMTFHNLEIENLESISVDDLVNKFSTVMLLLS